MEHATIKQYRTDPDTGKQIYRIIPDDGYMLKNTKTEKLYSEAITDTPANFIAVEK